MKKKLLISTIVLMLIVAMAVGFTTAQQQRMTKVGNNYVTIGDVEVTCDPASGLIQQGPMAADGSEYTWTGTLKSTATINQDVYAGLCDEDWLTEGGVLGDAVWFKLKVGGTWVVENWKKVDYLFKNWVKIATNMAPDAERALTIQLKLDPNADYDELMGIKHWFKVLFFAVNVGGSAPTDLPYMFSAWYPPPSP